MELAKVINELEINGIITVINAIDRNELDTLQRIYDSSWNEIKEQLAYLDWKRIKFNSTVQINTGFIGKNVYDGKLIASYPKNGNSQIINMGNERYDFTHGFENIKLKSEIVNNVIQKVLHCEYNSYIGALPILEYIRPLDAIRNRVKLQGVWHRDAYSLFDDETIDLEIKPFYYTVLIPLDDMNSSGRTTEFILGSHRVNLRENNITNMTELDKWCNNGVVRKYKLECKAGDVCIFHGYLIHRGLDFSNMNGSVRVCYAVYKKNWYNDEPEENYVLEESGSILK
jgi:hypothetical protein